MRMMLRMVDLPQSYLFSFSYKIHDIGTLKRRRRRTNMRTCARTCARTGCVRTSMWTCMRTCMRTCARTCARTGCMRSHTRTVAGWVECRSHLYQAARDKFAVGASSPILPTLCTQCAPVCAQQQLLCICVLQMTSCALSYNAHSCM